VRGSALLIRWLVCVVLASAAGPVVAADGFPDDWFYEGAKRPQPLKALEGKPAPELSTSTWIGTASTLAEARGKVVVVDFWATWCGPCMASIPKNVALVEKLAGKPFLFLGIHDANNGWDKAASVVRDNKINYSVAKDTGSTVTAYALQFWPTYVVVDHEGIVRAAGLLPDRVDDVVEALLAKVPASSGAGGAANSAPADWVYGGATRPSWLVAAEGTRLRLLGPPAEPEDAAPTAPFSAKLADAEWLGDPKELLAREPKAIVALFLAPSSDVGLGHLKELALFAKEFAPQGVAVLGVCDVRADWKAAAERLEGARGAVPILRDGAPPQPNERRPKPSPLGATAADLDVRLAPCIVITDATGTVRVAGARLDKVREIVTALLAEPARPATP
jgi:thiol-disulfide isomerase/thioredoxin